MAAIFFLIFVILLLRNPEDRRKSDLNKYLVIGSIFLGFIGSIINNGSIAGLAIFAIITYLISLLLKKNKYEKKSKEYGFYETKFKEDQPGYNASYQRTTQQGSAWQTSTQQAAQQSSSDKFNSRGQGPGRPNFTGDAVYGATSLPSSAVKRRKIVAKFNEKYELCLTDAQIQKDHQMKNLMDVPKCDNEEFDYYVRNKAVVRSVDELQRYLQKHANTKPFEINVRLDFTCNIKEMAQKASDYVVKHFVIAGGCIDIKVDSQYREGQNILIMTGR